MTGGAGRPYSPGGMSEEQATREYRTGSDPRTLRDALGCFATGVTVVTCLDGDGAPVGLTANSFTALSLDPPLLLVCVARNSASAAALANAETFRGQRAPDRAAARLDHFFYPRRGSLRPDRVERWRTWRPVLMESLSVFECRRHAVHEGGDHYILVGEVIKASFESGLDPLLYFRGRYRRLHFD